MNLSTCKRKAEFFFRLSFHNCFCCVYNCDDHLFMISTHFVSVMWPNCTGAYVVEAALKSIKRRRNINHQAFTVVISHHLTNGFHFAVRLYSDNAQMTSKHGKNKEVHSVQTHGKMKSICFIQ